MKFRGFLLGCMCCLLSSCIGTAFVAGAATGGYIVNDRRSTDTIVLDQNIEQQVYNKLYADPTIKERTHVNVTSFNRVVLLVGQVPNAELRKQIVALAQQVPHIKRIYNELKVEETTSFGRRSKDVWLAGKIRTQLLVTKDLHSSQITIVVENGVVYLLGLVTPEQGRLAAESTRRVEGVTRVVKIFEYLSVVN